MKKPISISEIKEIKEISVIPKGNIKKWQKTAKKLVKNSNGITSLQKSIANFFPVNSTLVTEDGFVFKVIENKKGRLKIIPLIKKIQKKS